MIENNAFIVLNYSFLTARMRLPGSRREFEVEKISAARGDPESFGAGPARIRTWDQGIMSPLL